MGSIPYWDFVYAIRADTHAGLIYSLPARVGYGLARSPAWAFSEPSSAGSLGWHLNLRHAGDRLRGRRRAFSPAGMIFCVGIYLIRVIKAVLRLACTASCVAI